MYQSSDCIQILIKMPNPSQEPPASSKAPNKDLKDIEVLFTFKTKIENTNSEYRCIKDQWPYANQDKDAKPQSGTSSPHQSPRSGLQGHGCFLHLQNQDREPKFGTWFYQRPVTLFNDFSDHEFSVDPPGGSTLGEAVFVHTFVRPSPLTLFVYNSGSEWDIFLKSFGDIPGMFLDYFWIILNFLYVCRSVSWLSSLLNLDKYRDISWSG